MTMKMQLSVIIVACLVVVTSGCGDDEPSAAAPYGVGKTVVSGDGGSTVYDTPEGDACIDIGSQCIPPQKYCGQNAKIDVIVDSDGEYVETVCYPSDGVTHEDHKGSIKTDEDGASIVLDNKDDGADVTDNVEFKGNDSTLYGHGPEVSVIRGNVKIIGDNAALRGIRIEGNVDLEGDGAHLINCVIEGNLHVKGNGNTVVDCIVFGDLKTDATNTKLIANYVQKELRSDHESSWCSGNYNFTDANENLRIDPSEYDGAEAVSCPTQD
jgi:hypothetical protein